MVCTVSSKFFFYRDFIFCLTFKHFLCCYRYFTAICNLSQWKPWSPNFGYSTFASICALKFGQGTALNIILKESVVGIFSLFVVVNWVALDNDVIDGDDVRLTLRGSSLIASPNDFRARCFFLSKQFPHVPHQVCSRTPLRTLKYMAWNQIFVFVNIKMFCFPEANKHDKIRHVWIKSHKWRVNEWVNFSCVS